MGVLNNHQWSWYNFWISFLVSLGQIAFGYPSSIIGTTLGEPPFLLYMGLIDAEGKPTGKSDALIGAMNGVFQAGAFTGIMIVSTVMDRYGRKAGVMFCSGWSIFGGALLAGAKNPAMFIVARFFAGMGSWGFLAVTPIYSAELAPPKIRGLFVGLNGVFIALGYGLASYFGTAFFYAESPTAKWRGPLGFALLWPIIILAVLPIVPESPRFLLLKGRVQEAEDVVLRLHALPGDEENEFARSEFHQMKTQAEFDVRQGETSWIEMFSKPSNRKRTALAMGYAFLGQSTAVLIINNYGPRLYSSLGFGTEDQLRLQCGWISVGVLFNIIGALIMDRVGRRPLMIIGVAGCCGCLIVEAAMVAQYAEAGTNKAGLGVGVAAFYVFLAFFSIGCDVAGVTFYSEIFPNPMRAKGICLSIATIAITDLIYLEVGPTAFTHVGWKFYLLFIIISGLGAIVCYFVLPETKGIPLEEMAKLFGDTDNVVEYLSDVHVDHNTHEIIVEKDGAHAAGAEVNEKAGGADHVEEVPRV